MGDRMLGLWRFGWMRCEPGVSGYGNYRGEWVRILGWLFWLRTRAVES
jgi:hypothetical protein